MKTPDNSQIDSRYYSSWRDQINTIPNVPKRMPGALGRAEIKEAQGAEAQKERIASVKKIAKHVAGAVVAAVIGGASLPHDGADNNTAGQNQPTFSSASVDMENGGN